MQCTRPLRHSPVRTPTQSTLYRTAAIFLPLAGVKADLLLTPAELNYGQFLELSAKVGTRLAFVKAVNSAMLSIRNGERSRSIQVQGAHPAASASSLSNLALGISH